MPDGYSTFDYFRFYKGFSVTELVSVIILSTFMNYRLVVTDADISGVIVMYAMNLHSTD